MSTEEFAPFIDVLIKNTNINKVSFGGKKTNERVLNKTLHNISVLSIVNDIEFVIDSCEILESDYNKIQICWHGLSDIDKSTVTIENYIVMSLGSEFINVTIDKSLQRKISVIKSYYPFQYFTFFNIYNCIYILFQLNREDLAKYMTTRVIDLLVDKISCRYFAKSSSNSMSISRLYEAFYKDKVECLVYDDYKLVVDFFSIYKNDDRHDYINFMVGMYKMFIYFRNKYNRELKKIATKLYNGEYQSLIDLDATAYDSDLTNSEKISTVHISF